MLRLFKKQILSSVARQLILGIAVVHAVLMTVFMLDLIERQRSFMQQQSLQLATGIANTLATNGSTWVLANDIVGIEEVIRSQSNFKDLLYAMIIDNNGKILGYTERDQVGNYLQDEESLKILDQHHSLKVVLETDHFVDIAAPIIVNHKHIGWARVGLSRSSMVSNLDLATQNGLVYTIIAIVIGVIFAWIFANGITSGIRKLKAAVSSVTSGERDVNCTLNRFDELEELSNDFNQMLITINDRERSLIEARDLLTKSQQKFSQLVTNLRSEYVFYSHDVNGDFTYVSPSIKDVLGYSVDEYSARYDTFYTDNIINISARTYTERVIEGQQLPSYEVEVYHKDGRKLLMEVNESPVFDDQGRVISVDGLAKNITTQREIERQIKAEKDKLLTEQSLLNSIINSIPDQIYFKNKAGQYIGTNRAFEEYTGLSREQIIGKTDAELFDTATTSRRSEIEHTLSLSGHSIHQEDAVLSPTNVKITLDTIYTTFSNKDGELLGFIGISRDITEQKYQNLLMRRSQKMDALGKLSGGIAHDYNNLLGIIMGYAELITQTSKDDHQKEYAEQIFEAGKRGSRLTKKLLAFTREQSSGAEVVEINELLINDLNMLQKTLTARINIKLDLEEESLPVNVNRGDFQDSVLNISINAMHAMPNGGDYIIKTRKIQLDKIEASAKNMTPGQYVRVSFTDNGTGMDEETKERLFDPFYSTKGSMGSGLGLSQVFGFVKRSGGHIYVYSELGKGSTISIYFQKQNALDTKETEVENVAPEMAANNETILVVDDEPALRTLASEILSSAGFKTFEADSAQAALKVLESFKVDLILSDVIMPNIDGYELARAVQEQYPDIKIILASGFTNTNINNKEFSELNDNLLHKPYNSKSLISAIKSALYS